jgi:acyl-CoA hydrolase
VIVFVAVDDAGKPIPVPTWTPQDDEERRLAEYAQQAMAMSKDIEATVSRFRSVPTE